MVINRNGMVIKSERYGNKGNGMVIKRIQTERINVLRNQSLEGNRVRRKSEDT
jgi:hypothetical protein